MILFRSVILLLSIYTIKSIDVLTPVSTIPPNEQLYPRVIHPRQPQRLSIPNGRPLHTNKYYINAILGPGSNPIISHPYVLVMNTAAPLGVSISCTEQFSLGPKIDDTRVKYFINLILKNMIVTATEFTSQNFQITDVDDPGFSVTIKMSQPGSQASITMPVVRGMAYVTFEYNSATPKITTIHAVLSVNGQTSGTITGKRFEISLNNDQTWVLYALNGEITLELRGNELYGTQPITNVLRLTKKQSNAFANSLLDTHVSTYPVNCQLKANVTDNEGNYTFVWERKGDLTTTLLHYTFPHHRQILANSVTATPIQTLSPSKGPMIGYLGNIWVLRESSLSTMGFLPPRPPAPEHNSAILSELRKDLAAGVNLAVNDYYFTGKAYYKYAVLCLLADYYNETTLRNQCIKTLESAFDGLVTGKNSNALKYDTTWSGLVSPSGLLLV